MNRNLPKFGPTAPDHPTVGQECKACNQPIAVGDYTTIIPLGPGEHDDDRRKAREGRPYRAVGVLVHWACATGEE